MGNMFELNVQKAMEAYTTTRTATTESILNITQIIPRNQSQLKGVIPIT